MVAFETLPWRSRMAVRARKLPLGNSLVKVLRSFRGEGDPSDQWQRIVLNRELRRLVDDLKPGTLKALEISGSNWPREGYFREYRDVSYPEYDVCAGALDDKFDIINGRTGF